MDWPGSGTSKSVWDIPQCAVLAGNVASGYGRVCVRCVSRFGMAVPVKAVPVKALAILELLLARTTQPKIFFCTVG